MATHRRNSILRSKPTQKSGAIEPTIRDEVKRVLLETLGRYNIIQTACDAAGINRNTFYNWQKEGYLTPEELAEAYERWQDVLREELLKVGIVGVQQPLVHNGRIVLESDGRKAFINKRDNRVLIELAEKYLPEWQQAKKLDITQHTDSSNAIPDMYDLHIDGRFLTHGEVTIIRDIVLLSESRKAQMVVEADAGQIIYGNYTQPQTFYNGEGE